MYVYVLYTHVCMCVCVCFYIVQAPELIIFIRSVGKISVGRRRSTDGEDGGERDGECEKEPNDDRMY